MVAGVISGATSVIALGAVAGVLVLSVGDRYLRRHDAIPVLVWHSVSENADWLPWADNISVRPEVFAAQIDALLRWGFSIVSDRALAASMQGQLELPDHAVVLNFDDGYRDNLRAALPVLQARGAPATIFIASDFIEPETRSDMEWKGYLSAQELRQIDANPLFEIASHGRDHGRLPVSGRSVETFSPTNWKMHAAVIWGRVPGNKSKWYEAETPVPFAFGDPVPQTDSALTARHWVNGKAEDAAGFAGRVTGHLGDARSTLEEALGRSVDFLCWPFDRVTDEARASARAAGFQLMTGGRGYNAPGESIEQISRMHITDFVFGGGPVWCEVLGFRAKVMMASGNLYWMPVVWVASWLRRRKFRAGLNPVANPAAHR